MIDYLNERLIALKAARLAGQLCLAVRDNMPEKSIEKAGKEPVTIADYGAQAVILKHIMDNFPDDGVIAEEGGSDFDSLATADQKAAVADQVGRVLEATVNPADVMTWLDAGSGLNSNRIWTVDPIDGTKGFLRGEQFAVAIALLVDGEPVVGALCCPVFPFSPDQMEQGHGVVAMAVKGQGANLEAFDSHASRPLKVSSRTGLAQSRAVESVEAGHTDHGFSQNVLLEAGIGGAPVRMDSQAKYVAVADGRAKFYIRNSRGGYKEKIWDHAAGVLIVLESGGRITDMDSKPLDFSQGARMDDNRGILATNTLLHDTLLNAIRVVEAAGE